MTSRSSPPSEAITSRLWLLSLSSSRSPATSASTLPGNRSGVAGCTIGQPVETAAATRRAGLGRDSTAGPGVAVHRHPRTRFRRCVPQQTKPSGSIRNTVGQLRTPNNSQTRRSASLMTGCSISYRRTASSMFLASRSVSNLARVDADHDQLLRIRPLQFLQLRQDVHAVDAAVGPEVQQHESALQILAA